MGIILLILKSIGVILAVLLLLILFGPIRYQVQASAKDGHFSLRAELSYCYVLLKFCFWTHDEEKGKRWQILGIFRKEDGGAEEKEKEKKKRRKKDGEEKEKSKEGKPSSRNASLSRLKKITETEAGRAGLKHILSELVRLFRQCLPTRFSLTGRFGFSDPALTGQAAGFLITLMMTYPDTVDILPDFEKEILEGEFAAEGSVYGVYALVFLIRVLIHTEARQTILYLLRGKA